MNDRELLEMAAKAAGYSGAWIKWPGARHPLDVELGFFHGSDGSVWNPFASDGGALRLAVKLRMEIDHNHDADNCLWVSVRVPRQVFCAVEEFADESERASSTRRAITRAAAEIGRNMP